MLGKLLKYDLSWIINKYLVIYYVLTLVICIITRVLSNFTDVVIVNIIYLILRGFTVSAFVSVLINAFIRIWIRFKNNFYKDEAYLTHTLPVEKSTLVSSKIWASVITCACTLIVILVGLLIVFLDSNLIDLIRDVFSKGNYVSSMIFLVFIAFFEIFCMMLCGFVGIVLGYKRNSLKDAYSVIYGLGVYFVVQLIVLIVIYLLSLVISDVRLFFGNSILDISDKSMSIFSFVCMVIYLVLNSVLIWIIRSNFLKGVNVD